MTSRPRCISAELYSTHPFRIFTLASSIRSRARQDIAPSIYCLEQSKRETCRNADANTGWTQGLLNAALLGRAARASEQVLERSRTEPATGYRFPAFMPHLQDYQPSEDHLANMNTALQLMLLAPAAAQVRCKLGQVQRADGTFVLGSCEELLLLGSKIGDKGAVQLAL